MENTIQALTPQIFTHPQFGSLRIVTLDKIIWFVGKDVAKALGYKNHKDALKRHVDAADKKDGVAIPDPIGRIQKMTLINKSGLFSLLLDSQLPKAKEYRHWVTSEVLPTLHETGTYTVDAAANRRAGQPIRRNVK